MVFRYKTKKFKDYLIIEDTLTKQSIEVFREDVDCILGNFLLGVKEGVTSNSSYTINECIATIKSNNSSIDINILDLGVIVRNGVGVINMEKYIEYGKLPRMVIV